LRLKYQGRKTIKIPDRLSGTSTSLGGAILHRFKHNPKIALTLSVVILIRDWWLYRW
jgi:hypothetical protein